MKTVNCGKGIFIDVDYSRFDETVMEYLVELGVKNALRDVHAGVSDPEEAKKRVEEKLQALYSGETRRSNGFQRKAELLESIKEKEQRIRELEAALAAKSRRK
jgi:hypothetical protein